MKAKHLLLSLMMVATSAMAEVKPNPATTPLQRPEPGPQERHARFNEISKQGEAQVVFLGDSITQGWEGKGKAAWEKYFAPLKAANFGIGADRTEHVIWRLENGNFDGLKPKVVVLMIGTNNTGHQGRNGYECSAEQTAAGVKKILELIHKKTPETKILVLGIFPRGADNTDKFRVQNQQTNELIKAFADNQKVFYKDIGAAFLQPDGTLTREIMPDLLHLSEQGYEIWSKQIIDDVKRLLN